MSGEMRERTIERAAAAQALARNGRALKWVSPGHAGAPDRLVLFPGARAGFLELKAPGERPTPLQLHRMEELRAMGFVADWADSVERAVEVLERIKEGRC